VIVKQKHDGKKLISKLIFFSSVLLLPVFMAIIQQKSALAESLVKNWRIWWSSFAVHMPLLMATTAFILGISY